MELQEDLTHPVGPHEDIAAAIDPPSRGGPLPALLLLERARKEGIGG